MHRVKIHGAGSIGNHLSHAARRLGWSVDICDIDPAALQRTREQIYPARYGQWDDSIRLFESKDAPRGGYDLIVVGTPPDSHIPLAMDAVQEGAQAILVEKPFCTPDLAGAQQLWESARERAVTIFTGYDHVVGAASEAAGRALADRSLGPIETLDVEFREYWGGIFAAHPWLDGPADSYLGYWKRGGGASGEHSHALNLWQHFAHGLGAGRVTEVSATMDFVSDGRLDYDKLCALHMRTESGLTGRVVQDVVTSPTRKWARAQFKDGWVEWHCGYRSGVDGVLRGTGKGTSGEQLFEKTRPQDFIQELTHLDARLKDGQPSPISIERGLDTMLVLAAAHRSAQRKCSVRIDYSHGYVPAALEDAQ